MNPPLASTVPSAQMTHNATPACLPTARQTEPFHTITPDRPKCPVSVVIPVFNREHTLERCIRSVLQQTCPPSEIILIDDGSTDGTSSILQNYSPWIRQTRQPNSGVSAARNRGISMATHPYVAFLDSDDEWLEQKLETQVAAMENSPDLAFSATGAFYLDGPTHRCLMMSCTEQRGHLLPDLLFDDFILTSSMMVRRSALNDLDSWFDTSLDWAEDYDLKVRLAARGPAALLPQPLVRYYTTNDGLSRRHAPPELGRSLEHLLQKWKLDPAVKPYLNLDPAILQASMAYRVAREHYRIGENQAARTILRKVWFSLPKNHRRSAALMLLFPRSVQTLVRFMKAQFGSILPLGKRPKPRSTTMNQPPITTS